MAVAFMAYAFKDCMDSGGDGIKLDCFGRKGLRLRSGWFGRECGSPMDHLGLPAGLYDKKVPYFWLTALLLVQIKGRLIIQSFRWSNFLKWQYILMLNSLLVPAVNTKATKWFSRAIMLVHTENKHILILLLPIVVKRDGIGNRKLCKCRTWTIWICLCSHACPAATRNLHENKVD